MKLSEWVTTTASVVGLGYAGWVGVTLTQVGNNVAYLKARAESELHLLKGLKENYEELDDKYDNHESRIVRIESVLEIGSR